MMDRRSWYPSGCMMDRRFGIPQALPGDEREGKVLRYEAHLSKEFQRTLQQLLTLQHPPGR